MKQYDLVGDYDLEMVEFENGDYYLVEDVKALLNEILNSNFYEERSYVNVQIPREIWERMQEMIRK